MKRRIPAILLTLVLLFTVFAAAESIGCPRMDSTPCSMAGSEGCAMVNGSCSMTGSEGCAMMNGSCPMMDSNGCARINGSCPMTGSEGCAMMSGSCSMNGSEDCAMMSGSCSMTGSEGCAMMSGSACHMHAAADTSLPCSVIGHSIDVYMPLPAYHYLICEDCTLITGVDYYCCLRCCPICGLHVHAQETHHDCPIAGTIIF